MELGKGLIMSDPSHPEQVLVIPCSGIGKVHGLVSREATYSALEALPGQTDTVCLALLVQGDPETRERVRRLPSITVDGCPKLCAGRTSSWPAARLCRRCGCTTHSRSIAA